MKQGFSNVKYRRILVTAARFGPKIAAKTTSITPAMVSAAAVYRCPR